MHRIAWKAHVTDIEEYQKRHDQIWPEMTAMLNEAGIHNYTIWNIGDELFAYMECDIDQRRPTSDSVWMVCLMVLYYTFIMKVN